MVVSVNDIPEMRRAFEGMVMESLEVGYTVAGGASGRSMRRELVIRNW